MESKSKNCETCNKSTLSLVLLRPSPIATQRPLAPLNADKVVSDDALMSGLLPSRVPTESRFALRLLRAGYVYVYIPSPPKGIKNWQVYRVTAQADLYPEEHPLFTPPLEDKACTDKKHNVTGAKLLHLPKHPDVHKITEVWIAYSANLWNDKLKGKNKENAQAMQLVSLKGGSPNTFKPTQPKLMEKVLECKLERLWVENSMEHVFPYNGLGHLHTLSMADNLRRAAACHPETEGHELAVVLRDPAGITAELNHIRERYHEFSQKKIKEYLDLESNQHALQSSHMVLSLRQLYQHSAHMTALNKWAPLMTRQEYGSPAVGGPFIGVHMAAYRKSDYMRREFLELPGEELLHHACAAYRRSTAAAVHGGVDRRPQEAAFCDAASAGGQPG